MTRRKELPIELLEPMVDMRLSRDEISDQELLESIQEWGIRNALLVRVHPDPEKHALGFYQVIDGRRRLRLGREAGLMMVPCDIDDIDDETAYSLALTLNLQRDDITARDIALWLYHMNMKFPHLKQKDLAKKMGKSPSWVSRHIKMADEFYAKNRGITPKTEHQARALRVMSPEMRERIIEQSSLSGELPSGASMMRKAKATSTPREVLESHRYQGDEFIVYVLQEQAGLTVSEAIDTLDKFKKKLLSWQRVKRRPLGEYKPRKDDVIVKLYAQLTQWYPTEVLDFVEKAIGPAKSIETWKSNCRGFLRKLFERTPVELRQSALEEYRG